MAISKRAKARLKIMSASEKAAVKKGHETPVRLRVDGD